MSPSEAIVLGATALAAVMATASVEARAEAGMPKPKARVAVPSPIDDLLPPGWRRITDLPPGIAAAALGPSSPNEGPRAVVVVSPVERAPDLSDWDDPRLRDYVARAIPGVAAVKKSGELGSPQIEIAARDGADPIRILHFLAGERSEWLVTVVAPTSQIDSIVGLLQKVRRAIEERTKTGTVRYAPKTRKL